MSCAFELDHYAELLEAAFHVAEMHVVGHAAVADHDVGVPGDHRGGDPGDVLAGVLAVGIGVYDHISAGGERDVEAALEGGGQPAVAPMTDDMVDAAATGDLGSTVAAAVVYHQHFDLVDSRDLPRQGSERGRQRGGFIEAGNLDDELGHRRASLNRCRSSSRDIPLPH